MILSDSFKRFVGNLNAFFDKFVGKAVVDEVVVVGREE